MLARLETFRVECTVRVDLITLPCHLDVATIALGRDRFWTSGHRYCDAGVRVFVNAGYRGFYMGPLGTDNVSILFVRLEVLSLGNQVPESAAAAMAMIDPVQGERLARGGGVGGPVQPL
jgi:hypothetical protein